MEPWRAHPIQMIDGVCVFSDTKEPTAGSNRPCGHCGLPDTPEGHDGCLGTLPGVMNACCGHGKQSSAYVQFHDGRRIAGQSAIRWIEEIF